MDDLDAYMQLLGKARASLPENIGHKERWAIPQPDIIKEGRMTLLRNFRDIVTAVRRDEGHVSKYLLSQIGTAGQVDGDRLVFTGRVTEQQVLSRLDDYVATFVQCSECGSPDTHLERDGRVQLLKCEACGAHHPVKARKAQRRTEAGVQVREGSVLQVTIDRAGSKGQGMAEVEGYTVVVPKAPVGSTQKVRIIRITGTIAVGEPV